MQSVTFIRSSPPQPSGSGRSDDSVVGCGAGGTRSAWITRRSGWPRFLAVRRLKRNTTRRERPADASSRRRRGGCRAASALVSPNTEMDRGQAQRRIARAGAEVERLGRSLRPRAAVAGPAVGRDRRRSGQRPRPGSPRGCAPRHRGSRRGAGVRDAPRARPRPALDRAGDLALAPAPARLAGLAPPEASSASTRAVSGAAPAAPIALLTREPASGGPRYDPKPTWRSSSIAEILPLLEVTSNREEPLARPVLAARRRCRPAASAVCRRRALVDQAQPLADASAAAGAAKASGPACRGHSPDTGRHCEAATNVGRSPGSPAIRSSSIELSHIMFCLCSLYWPADPERAS